MKEPLLGSNIRKRRTAIGLSQAELAEKAGISINFLSKLERNRSSRVSSDTLNLLAKGLNTSMESLVNGDSKQTLTEMGPKQAQLNKVLDSYTLLEREQLSEHILGLLEKRH